MPHMIRSRRSPDGISKSGTCSSSVILFTPSAPPDGAAVAAAAAAGAGAPGSVIDLPDSAYLYPQITVINQLSARTCS